MYIYIYMTIQGVSNRLPHLEAFGHPLDGIDHIVVLGYSSSRVPRPGSFHAPEPPGPFHGRPATNGGGGRPEDGAGPGVMEEVERTLTILEFWPMRFLDRSSLRTVCARARQMDFSLKWSWGRWCRCGDESEQLWPKKSGWRPCRPPETIVELSLCCLL